MSVNEYSTLTVSQAAGELGVPVTTLRRWTNEGRVPFLRTPGGQRRFTPKQIREIRTRILTANAAARELGISATTLRRWANRGLVPYITFSDGSRRYTWENVRAIQEQMNRRPSSTMQLRAA